MKTNIQANIDWRTSNLKVFRKWFNIDEETSTVSSTEPTKSTQSTGSTEATKTSDSTTTSPSGATELKISLISIYMYLSLYILL